MKAADLLHRAVTGPDGASLGHVIDIRVVQDGPVLGAFAALRVDGLVIGKRGLTSRLGYDRSGVRGPRILAGIVHALMSDNRYLPWAEIEDIGEVIRSRTGDLDEVPRID